MYMSILPMRSKCGVEFSMEDGALGLRQTLQSASSVHNVSFDVFIDCCDEKVVASSAAFCHIIRLPYERPFHHLSSAEGVSGLSYGTLREKCPTIQNGNQ